MSIERQGAMILALSVVFMVGALYVLADVLHWHLRKVETRGTITGIDGCSAMNMPRSRGTCLQTLHYQFPGPDGRRREGTDKISWGERQHYVGGSIIVYYDHRNAAQNITKTGLDSSRGWAVLLGAFSIICLFIGGFVVTATRVPA